MISDKWLQERIDRLWELENEENKILKELEKRGIELDGMDDKELRLIIITKNPNLQRK